MTKTFAVNDLDGLQKEFYRMYDPDYWLYRIMLLKNSHDNFDQLKSNLTKNTEETVDKDFKRVIRTEMHFLYFQMIETLFEIIFAVSESDNRDLWIALTFSNFRDNYKKIAELNDCSEIFVEKMKTEIDGKQTEVPVLRWIFYFIYPSKLSNEDWIKNLENIKRLLLTFARDFSDRGEYNAYKHSLRFYNSPFSMAIGITGSNQMHSLGSSEDCITFLEEQRKKNVSGELLPTGQIMRTQKPFDFQRDYEMCILIYAMIKNIIYTRKYTILDELHDQNFTMANFVDLDFYKTIFSKGVMKSSFTV
ncbi:MAG: hypothetical protein PHN89_05155 [Candidatus Pacebacteria bacterium]|nr:hypothetical protein [Candidatus Paceibacterota bacterium]